MIPQEQMLLLPLKMRHFFSQMVSDSKCPHTEEFFPITSAQGSKTNRANKKGAVSFEVIDEHRLNRGVEALLQTELTSNCSNMGRKNMLFQWTKKTHERRLTLYLKI